MPNVIVGRAPDKRVSGKYVFVVFLFINLLFFHKTCVIDTH